MFYSKFSTECASEKKFDNRSIFDKDMDETLWLTFWGPPCMYFEGQLYAVGLEDLLPDISRVWCPFTLRLFHW